MGLRTQDRAKPIYSRLGVTIKEHLQYIRKHREGEMTSAWHKPSK
jgi:hypothetical protein